MSETGNREGYTIERRSERFRLAFDLTAITTAVAIIALVLTTRRVAFVWPSIGLGFVYGVIMAWFLRKVWLTRTIDLRLLVITILLVFVPSLIVVEVTRQTGTLGTILVFYSVAVLPAAIYELVSIVKNATQDGGI